MNSLFTLAQATTLPPPPAPQAHDSVSALSIVLVVVIVLGSVAMIALGSRRFKRTSLPTDPNQHDATSPVESLVAPSEAEREVPSDPNMLSRLKRVTGAKANDGERRKLGQRKPDAAAASPDNVEIDAAQPTIAPSAAANEPAEPRFSEPIPINRRSPRKWQDEPVIAARRDEEPAGRTWEPGNEANFSGLTSDEVTRLQTPPAVVRAPQPSPRFRSASANAAYVAARAQGDDQLASELSVVVRELLFCSNSGEFLHGFALYSDAFLFRTMDDSGLNEDQFREVFANQAPKPIPDWTRLAELRDVQRFGVHMATATVVYAPFPGGIQMSPEQFRFLKNPDGSNWLIDDIEPHERAR